VLKNKLFFFESFEFFRSASDVSGNGNLAYTGGRQRSFTYNGSSGVKTVNLYQLASGESALPAAFAPSPPAAIPLLRKPMPDSTTYRQRHGGSRIATNNYYNAKTSTVGAKAVNNRKFQAHASTTI